MYTEAVEAVKSAIGIEDAGDRQDKVERAMKDIGRVVANLKDDIESVNKESKGRKLKIRDLEKDLETEKDNVVAKESEMEKLKSDSSLDEVTKERDKYKTYYDSSLESNRTKFVTDYDLLKDHNDFGKLSETLVVPEGEEKDWSTVSDDDIQKNRDAVQVARTYGLFPEKQPEGVNKDESSIGAGEKGLFDGMGKK